MKKRLIIAAGAVMLVLGGCGKNIDRNGGIAAPSPIAEEAAEEIWDENTNIRINYEALGIEEYEYPPVFFMEENLETAIIQLALCYNDFNEDVVNSETWKEIFVARFIQNSRLSFDYLDIISDKNKGKISMEELNYIHLSLTGTALDFSSCAGETVDRYDAASPLSYGTISDWDYEPTENGILVTASLEIRYDGTNNVHKRELAVNLEKNPYSCFDGYSILSISSKSLPSNIVPESGEYTFYGSDMMMEEEDGIFPFEFLYAENDLSYEHFVFVDMRKLPDFADYVRQNPGRDFQITFVLEAGEYDTIETVVPTDILLKDFNEK